MNDSSIIPEHETIEEFGQTCIKHPKGIATSSWHRMTVAILQSGQLRPYADSVYVADICFEGGGNTTKAGIDRPFFTHPDEKKVRELAYWLTGAKENPSSFGTQLTQCICIRKEETYSVWRICAVTPYWD